MKKIFISILILLSIAIACKKFDNPYDKKYDIEKVAPKNFKIDSINGSSVKLFWEKQTDYSVNYIIDRKVDSSNWVNNYALIENKTEFTDTTGNASRVYYRLYLKAGTRETTKQETYFGIPVLTTNILSNITFSSATCGGIITDNGNLPITARGVCWNTLQNPTITNYYTSDGTGNGSFASNLSGLTKNTTYFIRAYATNKHGTSYGNQLSFTTNATLPTITTNPITNITSNSATGGGNVTDSGGVKVTIRGVCWSTSPNPTTSNSYTNDGSGIGSFTSTLTGLTANTTYYVRAYATNSAGTAYGSLLNFSTTNNLPTVTTNSISNITQTTATGGGNVTNAGAASVTSRGICWSTSQNPTISYSHTTDGTGTGSFSSNLSGLTANTTYYVRAYATNSYGTAYGNQVSFTTTQNTSLPSVTTNSISNITQNTATGGGNVTNSGGANVTARGVCWSMSQNPTTTNSHTSDGSGTGTYTSSITGLTSSTSYYVRAYATNTYGTSYGNQVYFSTTSFICGTSTITDFDGNIYNSISIGSQCWMKQNLKATHYSNGTAMVDGTSAGDITGNYTTKYYFDYNNTPSNTIAYGKLYTWAAIMNGSASSSGVPSGVQGICPGGFHVPSDAEWTNLETYLGGSSVAGGKLKSTSYWLSPNTGATDSYGFTALPGGGRSPDGTFNGVSTSGSWWSSTEIFGSLIWYRYMGYYYGGVSRDSLYKSVGISIRCLKD